MDCQKCGKECSSSELCYECKRKKDNDDFHDLSNPTSPLTIAILGF